MLKSDCLQNFTAISDDHIFAHTARSAAKLLNFLHRCETQPHVCELAEDNVLPIKMWGWHGGDEELGGVGVGPSVRHRQQPGRLVLHIEVLVLELVPVYRVTSESVPTFKVSALVSWNSEVSNQSSFLLLTCNIKFGMTRWIFDPLYPNPGSPVHSCLKLSTVLGVISSKSSISILPTGSSSAEISKNTFVLFFFPQELPIFG